MSDERLTWEEIKKKYPNQWVGMVDVKYEGNDTYGNIESAVVIVSNGNKDDLNRRMFIDKELIARHTDVNKAMRDYPFLDIALSSLYVGGKKVEIVCMN